jgi:hypothetical protein
VNAVYLICLGGAGLFLAWSSTFGVSALLRSFDETPLKQPDGSPRDGTVAPPTFGSSSPPRTAVRCRRTVMFGALFPDITVGPRRVS